MSKDKEAFEAWHDALYYVSAAAAVKTEYGYPQDSYVQMRWEAWQAATSHYQPLLAAKDAEISELKALLEQWCGEGGIDGLDPAKTYNVTGTHLREILQAYRKLYAAANVLPSRVQGSGVGDATDTNVGNISQEALDRMKDVISGYRWGENLHETAEAALCVASSQQADEIARLQDKIERLRASAKQLQGESIELREENARHKEIASAIVAAAVMGQYFNNAGFSDEPEAERGGYEIHLHESIVRKAKEILAVDAFLKEKK